MLVLLCYVSMALPSQGQQLEAVAVAGSLAITQTLATPESISLAPAYAIATNGDGSKYDETGYRLSAFARMRLGQSRYFLQAETAYMSTEGQRYLIFYDLSSRYGPSWFIFGHHINRWEIAALGGYHLGRRGYVLLGPSLALNQREPLLPKKPGVYPATNELYNSLTQSVITAQITGQVGIGFTAGRFDFSLRLEQSLTPYTRRFTFDGTTYGYRQQIRQGLLTAGILLYKRKQPTMPAYPTN